mgnify:CR=1 FL=1
MLAFWVTLIKVIAPWVAAAVVIHYLNVYNEKKYPESIAHFSGDILLVGINYDKKTKEHQCQIEKYQK